ncbi:hypothetical protein BH23CHL2_BH23CHL2_35310 [soil metagenome]
MMPLLVTDTALYTVWLGSLALGVVVILVLAFLLGRIVNTAKEIEQGAAAIWAAGQRTTHNTIPPPPLSTTNRVVTGILVRAAGINDASEQIEAHASGCPG